MAQLHPVILSGGVGSRLWPLSRSLFPKQLLALAGDSSLIQDTACRATGPNFAKPLVVCNVEHRFLIAEQIRGAQIAPEAIILEPMGRNTAPAAAVAALMLVEKDPHAIMLLMPADHVVRNLDAFRQAVDSAAAAAAQGRLVTFGIAPSGPETGYGYIQRGAPLSENAQIFAVRRFVEKPDAATAERYIETGDYYWNSGMFMFRASSFLAELERLEPDMLAQCRCRAAVRDGKQDLDFFRLEPQAFGACKSISIDYAVMEHTPEGFGRARRNGLERYRLLESLWDASDKDAAATP